jgi:hypothetical protein
MPKIKYLSRIYDATPEAIAAREAEEKRAARAEYQKKYHRAWLLRKIN